jgi:hypothetical protein
LQCPFLDNAVGKTLSQNDARFEAIADAWCAATSPKPENAYRALRPEAAAR